MYDRNTTQKVIMPSRTFVVTTKGKEISFESPYEDAECLAKLAEYVANNKIIKSGFVSGLLNRRPLSEKQMAWVHKLVSGVSAPRDEEAKAMLPNATAPEPVLLKPSDFTIKIHRSRTGCIYVETNFGNMDDLPPEIMSTLQSLVSSPTACSQPMRASP